MSFAMEEMPHGVVAGKGLKPGEVSTGTSILVIPFEGGVVLGADTRVSTGSYVANRISDKIVQITPHIFCCRSGSAADTQALTDYCRYFLSHLRYEPPQQQQQQQQKRLALCVRNPLTRERESARSLSLVNCIDTDLTHAISLFLSLSLSFSV